MLDSETLWTLNVVRLTSLINSIDSRLHFTQQHITDALRVLYDYNHHDDTVDFDELLYQLALTDTAQQVSLIRLNSVLIARSHGELGRSTERLLPLSLCKLKMHDRALRVSPKKDPLIFSCNSSKRYPIFENFWHKHY